MNIIKRISNLWRLSGNLTNKGDEFLYLGGKENSVTGFGKPRMAQIIHMKDEEKIINEILKEE